MASGGALEELRDLSQWYPGFRKMHSPPPVFLGFAKLHGAVPAGVAWLRDCRQREIWSFAVRC